MDEREKLSFWVPRTLADSVRQKLLAHKIATRERITITDICTKALQDYIQRGETAQAVLEKAVKNYINPKEGNEMTNKTYAVLANENWENGHILTTVENFPPYNGYLIVDGITEDELENDDDVTEYVEVEVIDPGKGKKTDYYPPEDKHGYAIRF